VDEPVVEEVEDSVGGEGGDDQPEARAESGDGQRGKGGGDQRFGEQRRGGVPPDGKQDVVGGDDGQQDRIEGAVTIPSDGCGEDAGGGGQG